ncbi:MAG: guanylate kinase [Planctomycetota bacterium]|jgi:guanylate kinase
MTNEQGKLVIISGPSGVGKSTICAKVVEKLQAFLSVSVTTRPCGESEADGKNYWFISVDEFKKRIRNDDFLEYAEVFGNYYGTPKQPIDDAVAAGHNVILEIDVQGMLQVKKVRPKAITIFILPPRKEVLEKRIDGRARGEDEQTKKRRLEKAGTEIAAAWQHYDHMVVNDDLDQAVREVLDIIDGKIEDPI